MKQKMREVLPSKEEHDPAKLDQKKGHRYSKPNRQKKQEKLIQMNPRYRFRMGRDGCVYYLKKAGHDG